jgi:hypothetical protein
MPSVTFKAKPETVYNMDGTPAWTWVKVPALTRKHCDMDAFRRDKAFSGFANSDMFPAMLARAVKAAGVREHIRLDQVPECATITPSALLYTVTLDVNR